MADAAANQIDADIPQLSTEEFYTRLNALVAMVNDPHTHIWLDEPAAVALGFTLLRPREAVVMLDAVEAPAGETTVVLGPGWPGILLHEAVGHGLEADFNRKGFSAFSGRIGQKVASERHNARDIGAGRD